MTQTIGVIDLGSNSVRLSVVRVNRDGAFRVVATTKSAVRLASVVDSNGMIGSTGLERTLTALRDFLRIGRTHGVDLYLAVATAAVRQAVNGPEFIQEISTQTGVAFQTISEAEEAELAFLGALNTLDEKDGLLIDMGGASTELVRFSGRQVVTSTSLPYGAVNLTARFLPGGQGGPEAFTRLNTFLGELLATVPWIRSAKDLPLIGVGGTVRNIARMDRRSRSYPLEVLHNYRVAPASVEAVYRLVRSKSPAEREEIPGLSADRADIIGAGVAMIAQLLTRSGVRELVISGAGVREGLIYRHLLRDRPLPLVDDVLEHSVANMIQAYGLDEHRSRETVRLALALFDDLKPVHGLNDRSRRSLFAAAALAEVGSSVNVYGQEQHTFYLLCHGRLYGLTHRETLIAAAAAGFKSPGKTKSLIAPFAAILGQGDEAAIRYLGVITAMARELTLYEPGAVESVAVTLGSGEARLQLLSHSLPTGEISKLQALSEPFKKAMSMKLTVEG